MKILMLCLGNICRSPLAEGIMRSKLSDDFFVDSAGTAAYHSGEKADERSIKTAKKHGIDIDNHRAKQLKVSDFQDFDVIYCMDRNNYQNAMKIAPDEESLQKLKMMMPDRSDVPDPYYGGIDGFEAVYQMLDEACDVAVSNFQKNN